MTDVEVKALVRQRDSYRCRDCGMTNEQHEQEHGRALDVHRLIPGSAYRLESCVALCRSCHSQKPKSLADAFFSESEKSGLVFIYLNLYNRLDRVVWERLSAEADERGVHVSTVVDDLFYRYAGVFHPDYVI
jgi:hypothetical protein